jgi:hypothetical protein
MIFLTVTALSIVPKAGAAGIETLLMPGKVAKAHAKFEETCSNCHDRADRSRQSALCLDCHKDIAADVRRKGGFHGRLAGIATGQCTACHGEHLGRDADITKLDPSTFSHGATDFPLEGAHLTVACESCHTPRTAYRKASPVCGTCHRKDDVHQGQLDQNCGVCHSAIAWAGARLDHDKTSFPLRDAHRQVSCNACHVSGKYDGTPTRCVGCHMPDDVHVGVRGNDCASCHTTVEWKTAKFDHAKETQFALLGGHATLACGACHVGGDLKAPLPRDCNGCHRADDAHAGRFGSKCADCHGNEDWQHADFDHAARTKFSLLGAHVKLDCHVCHTAVVATQKLPSDCASCHRADDVHGGALKSSCDTCHGADSWKSDIRFDHDLSDFPLLGLHVVVSCAQCHVSKTFAGSPTQCIGCHASSDIHKGGLGRDCASCHSPNGWQVWDFDHGKQTRFALTGAHGRLNCHDCHRQPASLVKLPADCASCHRKDDIHLGQYGAQCQRCHTSITFKGARIQ